MMAERKEAPTRKPRGYGLALLLLIIAGLYAFTAYDQAILDWLQVNQAWMKEGMLNAPVMGPLIFVVLFALIIGLYVPGGVVLLLLSGALFPPLQANLLANIGNLCGALIGFLLARYLFYRDVQERYGNRLRLVNEGIRRHGGVYLFVLRLAPVVPSPVVNLTMGLTPIAVKTYVVATLLGRIPMTALYVNLGAELGTINTLSDILSTEIIGTLILLCLLMLAGNHFLKRRSA